MRTSATIFKNINIKSMCFLKNIFEKLLERTEIMVFSNLDKNFKINIPWQLSTPTLYYKDYVAGVHTIQKEVFETFPCPVTHRAAQTRI